MGWYSWPTAMCEAETKEDSDEGQQQGEQKEQPQEKDQKKEKSGGQEQKGSEPAQSSGEGRKKGDSGEPKNIGDNAKTAEKETEKAKEQHEGAHASSKAGQQEPVAVRKFSDEEAQRRREEHEEQGGNKSDDAPDPDDEEHVQVKTVPYDPRFPATNQARNCYTRYNEFYKCIADKGEDNAECKFYQRAYRSICPSEWVEGWNTAREEGNWFGKY